MPVTYEDFVKVTRETECGTVPFDGLIDNIIESNFCVICHSAGNGTLPVIDPTDYSSGLPDVEHGFYQPLSLWEASIERMRDGTMPPDAAGFSRVTAEEIATLDAWLADGYPATACP